MSETIEKIGREIERGSRIISLSGLTSTSAKAQVLARLYAATGRKFVVVADTNSELDVWRSDLEFFLSNGERAAEIVSFPSFTTDPYSGASPHAETQEERALALWRLTSGRGDIVITCARALVQRTVTRDEVGQLGYVLELGSDTPPEDIVDRLAATGYVQIGRAHV